MDKNKFIHINRSKYEFNDPNFKTNWKIELENFEKKMINKNKGNHIITEHNLYNSLPSKLYKKVNAIVKLPQLENDKEEIIDQTDFMTAAVEKKISKTEAFKDQSFFNESMLSDIIDMDRNFVNIDLKIDPKPVPRTFYKEKSGWMNAFLKKNRKDRVKWLSKIYKMEKRLLEKEMFDQAEELIDLAAKDFSIWINSLSSDSKSNITKELIKELFSIGLEGDVSTSLYVGQKPIKAIPNEVGEFWNLPELSLENNVIKMRKEDRKEDKKSLKYVAFGRTLPMDIRHPKAVFQKNLLKPNFPEELKSKEVLFQGIFHLRSAKAFIQHLIENPEIPKPKYLKDIGLFEVAPDAESRKHIPLYEYFIKNQ